MTEDNRLQIIDTSHLSPPTAANDLYASRKNVYERLLDGSPEVTICVLAFNRLDKTKRCVESVLKYTEGVSYELLLVDNGSTDETLDYFRSVQCPCKKILHITKNLGAQYATNLAMRSFSGQYFVLVVNDAVVTKNWLSNLPEIYVFVPLSSVFIICFSVFSRTRRFEWLRRALPMSAIYRKYHSPFLPMMKCRERRRSITGATRANGSSVSGL